MAAIQIAFDLMPNHPDHCLGYLKDDLSLGDLIDSETAEMASAGYEEVSVWGIVRANIKNRLEYHLQKHFGIIESA